MTAEMYEERLRKHGSFLLQIHDALGPYRGDGSLVEAVGELRAENERLRADLLTAYGQAAEQQVEIGRLCMRLGELRLSNDALFRLSQGWAKEVASVRRYTGCIDADLP